MENPEKKKNNSTRKKEQTDATMLQRVPKKRRGGDNAKTSETRAKFLWFFEQSFGNISASCEYAKIDRRTFYRWMKSDSRVNRKFQQSVLRLQPAERQLDFTEAMLMKRIAEGDTTAIIFTLKTKGKHRGYSEKLEITTTAGDEEVAKLKALIAARAQTKGVDFTEELRNFLDNFAGTVKPEIKVKLASELIQ